MIMFYGYVCRSYSTFNFASYNRCFRTCCSRLPQRRILVKSRNGFACNLRRSWSIDNSIRPSIQIQQRQNLIDFPHNRKIQTPITQIINNHHFTKHAKSVYRYHKAPSVFYTKFIGGRYIIIHQQVTICKPLFSNYLAAIPKAPHTTDDKS